MKKILVLVDSIDLDDSSGAKANVALILNLKEVGFDVKVYHYSHKRIELEGVKCVLIPEKKWSLWYFLSRSQRVFTRCTEINIHRFLEQCFGFSFTFFNDASSILKTIKNITYKPDFVLTLSKAASFRPHYAMLKVPKWHEKWIAYIHDPYPFYYYPKPYEWLEPGFKKKERFFKAVSQKASFSAFPSLLLKEWMGEYFPNFLSTGIVIPHQSANFKIKAIDVTSYYDITKFNVLHAGNLMKQRSPAGLIKGFQLFLKRNPTVKNNARLLLIGSASYHNNMLIKAEKEIEELYVHKTNKPFLEIQYLQHNTSVNIILESKSDISPFLPGKFPHCIKANKPILLLSPLKSETKRLLGNNYPYWAEVDDENNIALALQKLYDLWEKDNKALRLNLPDLERYVSPAFLKETLTILKR